MSFWQVLSFHFVSILFLMRMLKCCEACCEHWGVKWTLLWSDTKFGWLNVYGLTYSCSKVNDPCLSLSVLSVVNHDQSVWQRTKRLNQIQQAVLQTAANSCLLFAQFHKLLGWVSCMVAGTHLCFPFLTPDRAFKWQSGNIHYWAHCNECSIWL